MSKLLGKAPVIHWQLQGASNVATNGPDGVDSRTADSSYCTVHSF